MNIPNQILEELNQKSFNPSGMNSVVGLDGFVDKIVTPVDKRHGLEENFAPIETLDALGSRISAAAGESANLELFPRFDKLGGNDPNMVNDNNCLGHNVRYIEALARPSIVPVFEPIAKTLILFKSSLFTAIFE